MEARWQVWRFLDALGLMLESGADAASALEHALAAVANGVVRADLRAALDDVGSGGSLTDALARGRYVTATVRQLLSSGETAGRLPQTLIRICAAEREEIDSFDDEVFAWIPRVLYVLLIGWIGSQVFRW